MKPAARVTLAFALALLPTLLWTQSHPDESSQDKAKQQLVELENHWLQVEDDPDALQAILADDFLHVLSVGIITKDEQLAFMRKHPYPHGGSRHFEDLRVRVYGEIGIVNGTVVATAGGTTQKTLFTDVFARRDGRWQAVNAQELPASEHLRRKRSNRSTDEIGTRR